jgi:hypothetical protein
MCGIPIPCPSGLFPRLSDVSGAPFTSLQTATPVMAISRDAATGLASEPSSLMLASTIRFCTRIADQKSEKSPGRLRRQPSRATTNAAKRESNRLAILIVHHFASTPTRTCLRRYLHVGNSPIPKILEADRLSLHQGRDTIGMPRLRSRA